MEGTFHPSYRQREEQLRELEAQIGSSGERIGVLSASGVEHTQKDAEADFLEILLRRRRVLRNEMKKYKSERMNLDALAGKVASGSKSDPAAVG